MSECGGHRVGWFSSRRLRAANLVFAAASAFFAASACADEASCAAVFAAADATASAPHHAYITLVLLKGMPPNKSEAIVANGVAYDQDNGHWRRDPVTLEKALQIAREGRAEITHQCRLVGNESMDGEPALRYEMHAYDPQIGPTGGVSNLWISTSTHLLLHEHVEPTKDTYADTRYSYADVRSPDGLK